MKERLLKMKKWLLRMKEELLSMKDEIILECCVFFFFLIGLMIMSVGGMFQYLVRFLI